MKAEQMSSSDNVYDLLLKEIRPDYLVVDENFEIIYNNVSIPGFLTAKEPHNSNLLEVTSPALSLLLHKAITQALTQMRPQRLEVILSDDGPENSAQPINCRLKPIIDQEKSDKKYVILELNAFQETSGQVETIDYSRDHLIRDLSQKLEKTKSTFAQLENKLEATYEELQSTNEELQSSNEELQSSNEELQSLNEELYSVNSEFQERMKEINQLNEESDQLMEGAELGMLVIDKHASILKYTTTAKRLFKIQDNQEGKSIFSLERNFDIPDFSQFIYDGFQAGNIYDKEIKTYDDRYYIMRRIPLNNRLILLFLDINRVRNISQLFNIIFENTSDHMIIFDQESKIKMINTSASDSWRQTSTTGTSVLDNIQDEAQKRQVKSYLQRTLKEDESYEYLLRSTDTSGRNVTLACRTFAVRQTEGQLGVLIGRDITRQNQKDFVTHLLAEKLSDIVLVTDAEGKIILLSSRVTDEFQQFTPQGQVWNAVIELLDKDGKSQLKEAENPLIIAGMGISTEGFELHLVIHRTGESFHLLGDFFPLEAEGLSNGAIAYLNRA